MPDLASVAGFVFALRIACDRGVSRLGSAAADHISRHKNWTFAIAGLLIAANVVYVFHFAPRLRVESQACPVDGPSACRAASRMGRRVLWVSGGIYLVGLLSAYLREPLLRYFG